MYGTWSSSCPVCGALGLDVPPHVPNMWKRSSLTDINVYRIDRVSGERTAGLGSLFKQTTVDTDIMA
jgi:hypothetical protein